MGRNKFHGVPHLYPPGQPHYAMSRTDILNGTIQTAIAPGQTPEDVWKLNPPKDWNPAKSLLRLPQVVWLSSVPNQDYYSDDYYFRTSGYGMRQNVVDQTTTTGFSDTQAGPFVNLKSVKHRALKDRVEQQYNIGSVHSPHWDLHHSLTAAFESAANTINNLRKGRTWVQVVPWFPTDPVWEVNPSGGIETIHNADVEDGIGVVRPADATLCRMQVSVLDDQQYLFNLADPSNAAPFGSTGPFHLYMPGQITKPFVGTDFYHVFAGYHTFGIGGSNLLSRREQIAPIYSIAPGSANADIAMRFNPDFDGTVDGNVRTIHNRDSNWLDELENIGGWFKRYACDVYGYAPTQWPFSYKDPNVFRDQVWCIDSFAELQFLPDNYLSLPFWTSQDSVTTPSFFSPSAHFGARRLYRSPTTPRCVFLEQFIHDWVTRPGISPFDPYWDQVNNASWAKALSEDQRYASNGIKFAGTVDTTTSADELVRQIADHFGFNPSTGKDLPLISTP